jgi:hypothetical protein
MLLDGLCIMFSNFALAAAVLVLLNKSNMESAPFFAVKMSKSLKVWLSIVKCSNQIILVLIFSSYNNKFTAEKLISNRCDLKMHSSFCTKSYLQNNSLNILFNIKFD